MSICLPMLENTEVFNRCPLSFFTRLYMFVTVQSTGLCWVIAGSLLSHCWVIAGSLLGYCWVIAALSLGHCWVFVPHSPSLDLPSCLASTCGTWRYWGVPPASGSQTSPWFCPAEDENRRWTGGCAWLWLCHFKSSYASVFEEREHIYQQ